MRNTNGAADQLLLSSNEMPGGGGDAAPRTSPLRLLRGRMHWALLLALLLGGAGAVAGYFYVKPEYRSSGQVRILPTVRGVLPGSDVTEPIRHYDSYLEAQARLISSRQVIERAVQNDAWQRLGRGASDVDMRIFANQLELRQSRGSQVLELRFYDSDAAAAAAGINAVIEAYRSLYQQQQAQEDAQIYNQLHERQARLQREIAQLRQQRNRAAGQYGVEGLARRYQLQLEQLTEVQQMLRRTRVQIEAMHERMAQQESGGPLPAVPLETLAQHDLTIQQMLVQREELESYLQRGSQLGLGENHRETRRARIQLDDLNQRIEERAGRIDLDVLTLQSLRTGLDPMMPTLEQPLTLAELEARERDLEALHGQVRDEAIALGAQQQQVDELTSRVELRMADLTATEQRIERLNLETPLAQRLEVISWGEVVNVPYNQGRRVQMTVLGSGAGAMLGIGLVMLMGRFDRRLRRAEDAQGSLPSARLLGILPTIPDNLEDPEQVALAAHCVHHIRTLLQLGPTEPGVGQAMVITSPAQDSGKTSLATALGLSFATSEARTLLIDCDVVGAGLSRRLDVVVRRSLTQVLRQQRMVDDELLDEAEQLARGSGRPVGEVLLELGRITTEDLDRARAVRRESSLGLLDVCLGEPLTNCVAEAGIDRLSVLPVGSARPSQAGALSPAALRRVLDQARQHFDIVIVDTGPVPGSIEASMVASVADRTVLVVSRGDEKATVAGALEHLDSVGASLAGVVFNHASTEDVHRSSYTSAVSSAPKQRVMPPMRVDEVASARFGPVGSAVASFGETTARANGHAVHDED